MRVGVTGHRPNKLNWSYDYNHPCWRKLKQTFKRKLIELNCTDAWSGMALGVDTVFALAVLELKNEGYDIKLHCAIPCQGHSSKWFGESISIYNDILSKADEVIIVTDAPYKSYMMQKRNEYIVDRIEELLAVWDGTSGGTANCVKYAQKVGIEIDIITPSSIEKENSF